MLSDISFMIGEMCHLIEHGKSSKEWEKDEDLNAILNLVPGSPDWAVKASGNQNIFNQVTSHHIPSMPDHNHHRIINIPPYQGDNRISADSTKSDDGAALCQMQVSKIDEAPNGQRRITRSGSTCNVRLNTYEEVRYHFSHVHSTPHKTYDQEGGRCLWKGCDAVVTNVYRHVISHIGYRWYCMQTGCELSFSRDDELRGHLKEHGAYVPDGRGLDGCARTFSKKNKHKRGYQRRRVR